ncbi:DsrE family protein [Aureitalea marina]|uniref:Uncharacterized protein n=1 Tax=Aureitalea marina TaxID=930804 RepID=A0A2S7KN94_9FLAO|nr:DsrE family protein [Aureitalea marina]PQB04068.1 hypothetical protein BST85_03495 [Aureitalea marina]
MRQSIFCLFLMITAVITAQKTKKPGPVIMSYGPTSAVEDPDFVMDKAAEYKVLFDVTTSSESKPDQVNKGLETAARFLNMHVGAGKDPKTLNPVMIVHGGASYGLLRNEFYKEKYGVDNPNIGLIEELDRAGVEIYICGQTAAHRDIGEEKRLQEVKLALSAMTVLIELQQQGFAVITLK